MLLAAVKPVFFRELVSVFLDEGKHVEASAVMGQVDVMLKELDPPPEWLLRDVDVQAVRLAALSRQEAE